MKNIHVLRQGKKPERRCVLLLLLIASFFLFAAGVVRAQVVESGNQGGLNVTAGGLGSAEYVEYGSRKMVGITGFVDVDTHRRLGIEAEGRWLEWRQTANVHLETYSIGGRYHFDVGSRWEPYVKGLVGFGDFNFPYNLATGRYLVVTAGAGVDMRLTPRIYFRAADFEYQDWPQFTFGSITTPTVSTGFKVRIF